jgi:hypothetical protein
VTPVQLAARFARSAVPIIRFGGGAGGSRARSGSCHTIGRDQALALMERDTPSPKKQRMAAGGEEGMLGAAFSKCRK